MFEDLKRVFGSQSGRVLIYPSWGTGTWESAITNTLNRGDRVLMSRFGQFSHLWADMATRLRRDVVCIDVGWGEGVPVGRHQGCLESDPSIRAVFVTHNETATGVTSDVEAVRRATDSAGSDALLFAGGVSSVALIDFRREVWGIDLVVTSPQKGLMLRASLDLHPLLRVRRGRVGVVSRSGTPRYEAAAQPGELGIGISTSVGIGGDPVNDSSFADILALFESDSGTDAVIMIGEIGGPQEAAEAARWPESRRATLNLSDEPLGRAGSTLHCARPISSCRQSPVR